MIAAAGTPGWVVVVVTAIGAVFGGGGVVALLKVRPEGAKIVVEAAEGAVIVQTGVIKALRDDLTRAYALIEELRKEVAGMPGLRLENFRLKRRVEELEGAVHKIENETGNGQPTE
jgi:hypothetical protein